MKQSTITKSLVVAGLILTLLSAMGYLVYLCGFAFLTDERQNPAAFTGRMWDPYWAVTVMSPVLFILMFTKGILMALKSKITIFHKFFVIHILAVISIAIEVIVLSLIGAVLQNERFQLRQGQDRDSMFAGSLLQVIFLGGASLCFFLSYIPGPAGEDK